MNASIPSIAARRRGISMLYVPFMILMMIGFASLAVDWARVQLTKTQLLHAADAAARAGAAELAVGSNDQAITAAMTYAAANTADGSSVALNQSADVELGNWDSTARTFTPVTGNASANAVRVTARRLASRGSAVPLALAATLGKNSCDVSAQAIALVPSVGGYGIFALKSITMGGSSSDSYSSANGYTSGGTHGSIASNGSITLSGSADINGDAHAGTTLSISGAADVHGSTSKLTAPLTYANGRAGSFATNNDNADVPSYAMSGADFSLGSNKSVILPGGSYYFDNFTLSAHASLTFTGPATIYVYGNVTLSGGASTTDNLPKNLTIILCPDASGNPPGNITMSGNASIYATIYAPQSGLTMSGTSDIFGSVIANTVAMTGNSAVHYDTSLSTNTAVTSVK